jgi:hypothetical protein
MAAFQFDKLVFSKSTGTFAPPGGCGAGRKPHSDADAIVKPQTKTEAEIDCFTANEIDAISARTRSPTLLP